MGPGYGAEVQENWKLGRIDSAAVSREAWRQSRLLCGCGSPNQSTSPAVRVWQEDERRKYRLDPEVKDTVDILRKAGLHRPLITNGPSDSPRRKTEVTNFERWVSPIFISDGIGMVKPDPSVFAIAMHKLDSLPEDVRHICRQPGHRCGRSASRWPHCCMAISEGHRPQ